MDGNKQGQSAFIDDGFTRTSIIRGREGQYPDVKFTWRPTGIREQARFNQALRAASTSEQDQEIGAEALSRKILEWDVKDRDGRTAPITAQTLLRLHPSLFNRLYAIVIRMAEIPDVDCDGEWLGPQVDAAMNGSSVVGEMQKNSVGG